jgi:hypothetical protein
MFADVVTVPFVDMSRVVLMAAKVVSVSAMAIVTNTITADVIESLSLTVDFPRTNYHQS